MRGEAKKGKRSKDVYIFELSSQPSQAEEKEIASWDRQAGRHLLRLNPTRKKRRKGKRWYNRHTEQTRRQSIKGISPGGEGGKKKGGNRKKEQIGDPVEREEEGRSAAQGRVPFSCPHSAGGKRKKIASSAAYPATNAACSSSGIALRTSLGKERKEERGGRHKKKCGSTISMKRLGPLCPKEKKGRGWFQCTALRGVWQAHCIRGGGGREGRKGRGQKWWHCHQPSACIYSHETRGGGKKKEGGRRKALLEVSQAAIPGL